MQLLFSRLYILRFNLLVQLWDGYPLVTKSQVGNSFSVLKCVYAVVIKLLELIEPFVLTQYSMRLLRFRVETLNISCVLLTFDMEPLSLIQFHARKL